MEIQETAKVLALIRLGDNRQVDEAVVRHWHDLIGDLPVGDALEAVRSHRRGSTEWLTPAHVRAGVRRVRGGRLALAGDPVPDVDPDDVAAYQRRRLELRAQIASGGGQRLLGG